MNTIELRAAISLAFVYVLRMLGLFMVIPVIAISATQYPDYSAFLVGLAIGGYGLTQAVLQIPMGILSDRWGRKPVIYLGLLMFAAGSLVAANADSMWMLTLGRIMQGAGAIAGAVMALAADVTRESQRAKVMAIIGVSIGFSFYLALLTGPIVASHFGMQGIFWLTALLTIACLPLVKFGVVGEQKNAPSGDSLPRVEQLGAMLKHPSLWRLNCSVLVVHLLITCFFVQVPSLLLEAGYDLNRHWQIYAPVLLISVALLAVFMRVFKNLSQRLSFSVALLLMACGFALFLSGNIDLVMIILAATLFFAGFNFMEAHMPVLVSNIAPAGKKGSAMGIYASHQFMGAFLGGIVSGLLNQWFTAQYTFLACIVIIAMLMIVVQGVGMSERIKRVTLFAGNLPSEHEPSIQQALQKELNSLRGVEEVVIDYVDQAVYLKVKHTEFDITQARDALLK